ncbi:hypothetical protein GCM10010411_78400 [Actinomadura fulvescens]|uniref:Secreted protein n=1 Tax=Actinomadura fulvescens TaxID=46160 RepID=A0ABN3QL87_9ACTN
MIAAPIAALALGAGAAVPLLSDTGPAQKTIAKTASAGAPMAAPAAQTKAKARSYSYQKTLKGQGTSRGRVTLANGFIKIMGTHTDNSCRNGWSYTKVTISRVGPDRRPHKLGLTCGRTREVKFSHMFQGPETGLYIQVCTRHDEKCTTKNTWKRPD